MLLSTHRYPSHPKLKQQGQSQETPSLPVLSQTSYYSIPTTYTARIDISLEPHPSRTNEMPCKYSHAYQQSWSAPANKPTKFAARSELADRPHRRRADLLNQEGQYDNLS